MTRLALLRLLILTSLAALPTTQARAETPQAWVKENLPDVVKLYHHFHAHPELSFQEKETAARLAKEWEAVGFTVTPNVGGHGVVGILKNGDGPTLMLRTDLDALPVTEQTGLGYASKVTVINPDDGTETGVMHACGHDIHIANIIGVARYMAANKDLWSGTLMLIGQPAEERGAGAKAMLEDGLFERFPKPDYAVALHVDSSSATGTVGYRAGYALANVDSVDITCRGRGGHGAYPHTTIDPIVQAAQLVMALQTIVAREVKPLLKSDVRPIIVGGTGLYFSALTEGMADIPPTPSEIRSEADGLDLPTLIAGVDARTLSRIDIQNRARVQRAWEVQKATARSLSDWQDDTPPPVLDVKDAVPIVFDVDKQWLWDRITRRFDLMLESGALDEVERMRDLYDPSLPAFKAIGVPELMAYIDGRMTLDESRDRATISTRQFAKRQRTWFRARMKSWNRIDLSE